MKLFFSVGEPSGDLHGANLIRELRQLDPAVQCVGFGGPRMQAAGVELHADLTQKAVMWISRVLAHLRYFLGLLRQADRYFAESPPDAVVLIDYPGFNWWVARKAKARGIPVIYYGTPQLWAWAPWRVGKMRRLVDHALCKLPFEESWFRDRGVNATYVGHPYFDELATRQLDRNFVAVASQQQVQHVTLLPGSRDQEVEHNLPTLLKSARQIQQRRPDTHIFIACFSPRQAVRARKLVATARLEGITVHVGRTAELIEVADCCLACSGSVCLELLFHLKPSIVLYRISRFAFLVQAIFRTSKYITLTNLLADHHGLSPPVPEHLTAADVSKAMATQTVHWLEDATAREQNREVLRQLRAADANPGASKRAAAYVMRALSATRQADLQDRIDCPSRSEFREVA